MPKKRRRRDTQPDVPDITPRELQELRNRRHVHTHEIHGYEQVRGLRRRFRVALGYAPAER
jgi:hypothetical protein